MKKQPTNPITIHADERHMVGGGTDRWRPPNGSHQYRGSGTFQNGVGKWTPCTVCGKRKNHRTHGAPWRTCSYCGSIHPEDMLKLDIPEPKVTTIGGMEFTLDPVEWADWKYGYPHKLYVRLGDGRDGKFYSRHLKDHPDLIEPFNEKFGKYGVIFGLDANGLWFKAVR